MAAGDIVYARVPITLDVDSAADSAVQTALTTLFPILTYDVIHTTIIPPTGTQTKGILVVVAQAIIS